ncbi:hypothetical protein HanPSC8_Chr09g0371651 [Helianthus annuus]|nr:hypothetical protein HanPSC8_Chr09g0371651 [Helianthus annuus]
MKLSEHGSILSQIYLCSTETAAQLQMRIIKVRNVNCVELQLNCAAQYSHIFIHVNNINPF